MSNRRKAPKVKRKTRPKASPTDFNCLKPGDTVEIIAPGSHAPFEHLEMGAQILRSWGLNVVYNPDILNPWIFLSNSDEYRFQSLKSAMLKPEVDAVWCFRGGYGSIRLLPFLEKMAKPKRKKLIIGLSDISSLQIFADKKWNMPSLHGPLLDRIALGKLTPENLLELKRVLFEPDFVMKFSGLKPLNAAARKNKKIKAQVIGGNLMVATSTLGTAYSFKAKNRIIFLEELCERSYRIDRCLQQMKQAKIFETAAAVVFGDFTNCDEPNKENHVAEVLAAFCKDLKIPAFSGVENGHGDLQRPLFFNTQAELSCADSGEMLVYSPFSSRR